MSDLLATDWDLLRQFRDGNPDAMRQVFLHYAPKVSAMLQAGFAFQSAGRPFRFTGYSRIHDIENARQEIFLRAFAPRARLGYDGIRPFADYLFGILRNYLLSEFRRHEAALDQYRSLDESEAELAAEASVLPSADQLLEEQEVNQLLAEFVETLSDDQRRFYAARFAESRTQEEVAQVLGMTRIQVRRIEKKFRGSLEESFHRHLFEVPFDLGFYEGYVASHGGVPVEHRIESSAQGSTEPVPIYKRWWFWSGAGAVVLGAVATGIIVSNSSHSSRTDVPTLPVPP